MSLTRIRFLSDVSWDSGGWAGIGGSSGRRGAMALTEITSGQAALVASLPLSLRRELPRHALQIGI